MPSRRDVLALLGAASLPITKVIDSAAADAATGAGAVSRPRVRTITAGVRLRERRDLHRVESAIAFLKRGKRAFEEAGYEVETLRVATDPWAAVDSGQRNALASDLQALDRLVTQSGVIVSIGPVLTENRNDPALAAWAADLVRSTRSLSLSIVIASPHGVHDAAIPVAADTIVRLAQASADGIGNFRFAAAANIPAGTPFFPVAWHDGADSFAIGMESASVVEQALAESHQGAGEPEAHLKRRLDEVLTPVERIANELSQSAQRPYLGIDTSPAPAKDRSIAAAIEALIRTPFGSAGTLAACSTITAALKDTGVRTCGYCGLMLPILEDPLLAQRAGEGRYSIRDVLLYSSVCGTGLDVVPIPGDTSADSIAGLLRDVAALSTRLRKPLSARLFVVPGRKAGEMARFNDPVLTDSVILKLD
jgi:uncharacterized protein (UPF0210 family)